VELFTNFVLLVALAATLVVLGLQWLDSGQPSSSSAPSSSAAISAVVHHTLGGHT
jgi:hypothetical protein